MLWLEGEPADDLRDRVGFRNAGDAAAFVDFPVPDQQDALRMVQLAKQADCPGLKMAAAPDWLLDLCDMIGIPVWETCAGFAGNHACVVKAGNDAVRFNVHVYLSLRYGCARLAKILYKIKT